jgi:hypothetical protein
MKATFNARPPDAVIRPPARRQRQRKDIPEGAGRICTARILSGAPGLAKAPELHSFSRPALGRSKP